MRSLLRLLMLSLLALSQSSCTQDEIDSFCLIYNKVIVEKGDSKIIAPIGVKRRLLENEQFYVDNCPKT